MLDTDTLMVLDIPTTDITVKKQKWFLEHLLRTLEEDREKQRLKLRLLNKPFTKDVKLTESFKLNENKNIT